MGTNVRRYLTGLVALAVALAVLMGLSPAAFAASLDNPPPGTNLWYRVDGRNLLIGAIKKTARRQARILHESRCRSR